MNSANEKTRRDPKPNSKQAAGARDGNTAGSQQNRRGGKTSQNLNKQQDSATNGSAASTPQPPAQPDHVPMNGFNASEVLTMLNGGVDPKVPVYKPDTKETTAKASPWGTKAGAMASGKDFWLELRKQTTLILANNGERRGG